MGTDGAFNGGNWCGYTASKTRVEGCCPKCDRFIWAYGPGEGSLVSVTILCDRCGNVKVELTPKKPTEPT